MHETNKDVPSKHPRNSSLKVIVYWALYVLSDWLCTSFCMLHCRCSLFSAVSAEIVETGTTLICACIALSALSITQLFFTLVRLFYKVVWSDDWICFGIFSPSRHPTDTQYLFFTILCFFTLGRNLARQLIFISNRLLGAQMLTCCCGCCVQIFIRKTILWISTDWSLAQEGR